MDPVGGSVSQGPGPGSELFVGHLLLRPVFREEALPHGAPATDARTAGRARSGAGPYHGASEACDGGAGQVANAIVRVPLWGLYGLAVGFWWSAGP